MSDVMYDTDFVLWSEQQAEALRRLRTRERANDVDWDHLIEEVEDLGKSATRAVRSLLTRAIEHLLKAAAWPDAESRGHWLAEAAQFLRDARDQFAPSMRQQLDVSRMYASAFKAVDLIGAIGGVAPAALREECPLDLDALLSEATDLRAASEAMAAGGRDVRRHV